MQFRISSKVESEIFRLAQRHLNGEYHGTDRNGYSLLHWAVATGASANAIQVIVWKYGVSPNCRSKYQSTPMHVAAVHGNKEAVRALLSVGAKISLRNKDGETALFQAKKWDRKGIIAILKAHDASRSWTKERL